jgi:hypothetical protein
LGSSRQVTKKKRSDNTQRRKRDRKADYTPDFAPSSRRVSTAETLRYPLLSPFAHHAGQALEFGFLQRATATQNPAGDKEKSV